MTNFCVEGKAVQSKKTKKEYDIAPQSVEQAHEESLLSADETLSVLGPAPTLTTFPVSVEYDMSP